MDDRSAGLPLLPSTGTLYLYGQRWHIRDYEGKRVNDCYTGEREGVIIVRCMFLWDVGGRRCQFCVMTEYIFGMRVWMTGNGKALAQVQPPLRERHV
jgi:hypothetical protein